MSAPEFENRSGSHAGRGFRYQDAVAAWLAVRAWAGIDLASLVIPEGGDDVERRTESGRTFIQVKSRREHLGPLPAVAASGYIKALWDRHDSAAVQPVALELVVERGIADLEADDGGRITVSGRLLSLILAEARAGTLAIKTSLIHSHSPLQESVQIVSEKTGCSPLAAGLCFAQLLAVVGRLADENGRLTLANYRGLGVSDTDSIIVSTLAAVDHSHIERALRDGACESVDFLTPLHDSSFYLGVDVQPGHIVAGLVLSRAEPREALARGIEARGAALITGPSGSGKSAIMWDTVYALRHTVRWYRLLRVDPRDTPVLRQLIRTLRASVDSPVGFVVDDVGRRGAEGWDALTREFAAIPGVVLVGSIREEDMFLLDGRSRATEVRAEPDYKLAQYLYEKLKHAGRTAWPGWREPWQRSKGLVLEYVHILTEGRRFEETLAEQVNARLRAPERFLELAILRIVSLAGAAGASVDSTKLPGLLDVLEDDVGRSLYRLLDEHLVRFSSADMITGLHQLRSVELVRLTHAVAPPHLSASFAKAVHVVPSADIEPLVADGVIARGVTISAAIEALIVRFARKPDVEGLAAALRGLATARIAKSADRWLALPATKLLAPTQIGSAAMFGVAGVRLPDIEVLSDIMAAASELSAMKNELAEDPRRALLEAMPSALLISCISSIGDAASLDRFLSSMVGMPLNAAVRSALASRPPSILNGPLDEVASLLGTVAALDRPLAIAWTEQAGEEATIGRVPREVAWTSALVFEQASDGLVVRCDYRSVSDLVQSDAHGAVVRICELIVALAPRAEIAASTALAPNGAVAGSSVVSVAEKRIKRDNLPAAAIPAWNRRWASAVAIRIATASYSIYLSRAANIAERLPPLLERIFDAYLRIGKVPPVLLEKLGVAYTDAEGLTPPVVADVIQKEVVSGQVNTAVTKLQNVLFHASANVLRRFAKLPDGAPAYIAWIGDLLENLDDAIRNEPWHLIGDTKPPSLDRIRRLLVAMRALAGESHMSGLAPAQQWREVTRKAQVGRTLLTTGDVAEAQAIERRKKLASSYNQKARDAGLNVRIEVREVPQGILPWPPSEVVGLLPVTNVVEGVLAMSTAAQTLREFVDESIRITLIPVTEGHALPDFSISGYETLFPLIDIAETWIRSLGLPVFRSQCATAFGNAMGLASSLQSMDRLLLGLDGRPQAEVEARNKLEAQFAEAGDDFVRLCTSIVPSHVSFGLSYLAKTRSGDLLVADITHNALHQNGSASLFELMEFNIELMQAEFDQYSHASIL